MAANTVTIDKEYFETLLRRAQCHTVEGELTTPPLEPTVTIHMGDYDSFLETVRQYENLRRNLYRGGITDETLAILTQDDTPMRYTKLTVEEAATEDGPFVSQTQQSIPANKCIGPGTKHYAFGENNSHTPRDLYARDSNTRQSSPVDDEYVYTPDGLSDELDEGESGNNESLAKPQRRQYDKFAKRTILLTNLPDVTTHSDIVDAVRGGLLLEVYLRRHDRTACISFLEEAHADEFFRHVKRNDLYIRGKRVMIRWSERQFILPGYIANKISIGATRNLVIHKRNAKHTEDSIREDLEHIHNLVVIKVTLQGPDAHISTNSVHNALFARTCMMSRAKYKGCRIDWDQDECATPIEARQQHLTFNVAPKKTAGIPIVNRFQLLDMEGVDDDCQDESAPSTKGNSFGSTLAASALGVIA